MSGLASDRTVLRCTLYSGAIAITKLSLYFTYATATSDISLFNALRKSLDAARKREESNFSSIIVGRDIVKIAAHGLAHRKKKVTEIVIHRLLSTISFYCFNPNMVMITYYRQDYRGIY